VALVGYTNAGKSTLFNRLTGSEVLADAKMFATLDPTVRQAVLPSRRRVLLSDTVGFIRQLPTTLVESFRATLEEVVEASMLLHVVDATSAAASEHCAHVRTVLAEIGAEKTPQILVLNKADALLDVEEAGPGLAARLTGESGGTPALLVSARTGEGMAALLERIDQNLADDPVETVRLRFSLADLSGMHLLHEYGVVLKEEYDSEGCDVEAAVPRSLLRRLQPG
jgi:GTP-binding protein HflX